MLGPSRTHRRVARARRCHPAPLVRRAPHYGGSMSDTSPGRPGTIRLTVSQALIRFLTAQFSQRDGVRERFVPGTFGIFGHGNVAGLGQALLQNAVAPAEGEQHMEYYQSRNEQNMVHS